MAELKVIRAPKDTLPGDPDGALGVSWQIPDVPDLISSANDVASRTIHGPLWFNKTFWKWHSVCIFRENLPASAYENTEEALY
ncbi:hypothetical protein MRY87_10095 [bacterium]|nr:hypothetical protein [bacterium]